jgi:hypothetical protein
VTIAKSWQICLNQYLVDLIPPCCLSLRDQINRAFKENEALYDWFKLKIHSFDNKI